MERGQAQEARFVPRLNRRKPDEMREMVLSSKAVQEAIMDYSNENVPRQAAVEHARIIFNEMAAQMDVEKRAY